MEFLVEDVLRFDAAGNRLFGANQGPQEGLRA